MPVCHGNKLGLSQTRAGVSKARRGDGAILGGAKAPAHRVRGCKLWKWLEMDNRDDEENRGNEWPHGQ